MQRRQKRTINWTASVAAVASLIFLAYGGLHTGRWTPFYDKYKLDLVVIYFVAIAVVVAVNFWPAGGFKLKPPKRPPAPARVTPQIGLRSTAQIVSYFGSLADRARLAASGAEQASSAVLPAAALCIGRDAQIDFLADNLLIDPPTPTGILGPPGIGKTAIAICGVRVRKVAQHFGARRYFVRLDDARDQCDLVCAVALCLGAQSSTDLRSAVFAQLALTPQLRKR